MKSVFKASFGQRFLAYIVDFIVINIVPIIALAIYYSGKGMPNIIVYGFWLSLLSLPFAIVYYVMLPSYWEKQTVGRFLLRIKVIEQGNQELSMLNYFIREIFIYIVLVPLPFIFMFINKIAFNSFFIILSLLLVIINAALLIGNSDTTLSDDFAGTQMIAKD